MVADVLTADPADEDESLPGVERTLVPRDVRAWLRSDELALRCFRNYLVLAWVALVARFGQRRWFFADDWFMLAGRDGGDIRSVLASHNEHLMATVVVAYRVLFNVFGLRWTPFLICVVTLHLALVCVFRALLRHVGVSTWTSVVMAGALMMYGAGEENILWSIQISWDCALIFGILQLRAADHAGPIDRRDVAGLVGGVAALVSASSIGLTLVAITAGAAAIRGRWRRALFHSVPVVLGYGAWVVAFDPESPGEPGGPPIGTWLRWGAHGITGPISALAQHPVVAVAIGIVLASGLAASYRGTGPSWWRRHAIVLAMLGACPLLFLVIGWQRWRYGDEMASAPRYLYVGAILVLPALGLAVDALARRARPVGIAAGALVVAGIPANVALLDDPGFGTTTYEHERQLILGFAQDPLIDRLPSWVPLSTGPFENPGYNVGWLRDVRDRGWLPDPGTVDPRIANEFPLRFGVIEEPGSRVPLDDHCGSGADSIDLELREGDHLWVDDVVFGQTIEDGTATSRLVAFIPVRGRSMRLTVIVPSVTVRLISPDSGAPVMACVAP